MRQFGNPLDGSKVTKRFQAACRDAGVRPIRFHDLRHTFATQLAASAKVSLRTLQEFLGHADVKTTQIYSHYAPSTHEVEMVNAAFAAEPQQADTSDTAPDTGWDQTQTGPWRHGEGPWRGFWVIAVGPGLTGADPGLGSPAKPASGGVDVREQTAGRCAGSDGHQWAMLLRGAAVAFATLAVAAFAFAARADALTVAIYWANANTHTIGFATGDAVIVDNNFVHVAGGFPNGVAVYGDFVYWTVPDANAIGRAGMNGTGVDQTFITGLQGVQGVAVNSAGIFWTNTGTGSIGRANLDGTGINQNFITGASPSNLMAADADHLYWTILGQFADSIARADVSGGNLNPGFISAGADLDGPEGVAVDGAHIYWTNLLNGHIGQANLDGSGANGDFIEGAQNPTGIAVNAGQLYWSNFLSKSIGTADTNGSNVNQSFLPANGPEGVAAETLIAAPPPPPKIADLIAEVTAAGLPHGTERSLLAKLENAQRKVDAGQIAVACNGLGAYLNEVRAQNGKKLGGAYAQDLIDTAMRVQGALGCGTT